MSPSEFRVDRRAALKWMLAASAAMTLSQRQLLGVTSEQAAAPGTKGYGTDPLLNKDYAPGEFWPLTMTEHQRRTSAALCGLIIPAENGVPSAADLKVHDFIDEWISSPYPDQKGDREIVLQGLAWIDDESTRRFGKKFVELSAQEREAIADDICHAPDTKPELKEGARFFAKFRDLTAGGFYSTPEGMKDVGYVGNTPLIEFKGPPPEVLARLGITA